MTCELFKAETLTVKRQTNNPEYDDDGFPVASIDDDFEFEGNVQPISGNEILQVPEGDRTRQVLNVFTSFHLLPDDVVLRKGAEYEVRVVEDWTDNDPAHYKARIVRKDVEDG